MLADRYAISTDKGIEYIAQQILLEIRRETPPEPAADAAEIDDAAEVGNAAGVAAAEVAADVNTLVEDVKVEPVFRRNEDLLLRYILIGGALFLVFLLPLFFINSVVPAKRNPNHIDNPPEVYVENCQIGSSDVVNPLRRNISKISCDACSGFRDKKVSSIQVEIEVSTPEGNRTMPLWLHRDRWHKGDPFQPATYWIDAPYAVNEMSIKSENITVSLENIKAKN